jgi:acetyl esterase/lipase
MPKIDGTLARAPIPVRHTYARRRHAYVDVFVPQAKSEPFPILLVHGGYWRPRYSNSYLSPLARALATNGYCVGNAEYRRELGHPDLYVEDVAAAAGWFAEHTDAVPLLIGHSVGAQLALMACSIGAPASGLLLLAPVCDLQTAHRLGVSDNAVAHYLGPNEIDDWDPRLVTTPVPEVAIHSPVDLASPIQQSRSRAITGKCELIEVEDSGHYGVVNPLDKSFKVTLRAIKTLTQQCSAA